MLLLAGTGGSQTIVDSSAMRIVDRALFRHRPRPPSGSAARSDVPVSRSLGNTLYPTDGSDRDRLGVYDNIPTRRETQTTHPNSARASNSMW